MVLSITNQIESFFGVDHELVEIAITGEKLRDQYQIRENDTNRTYVIYISNKIYWRTDYGSVKQFCSLSLFSLEKSFAQQLIVFTKLKIFRM